MSKDRGIERYLDRDQVNYVTVVAIVTHSKRSTTDFAGTHSEELNSACCAKLQILRRDAIYMFD